MRALLRRSLSLRLLAIFVVTGAATLAVLVLLLREGLSAQWRRAIQPHLARYVEYALDELGDPPSLERARGIAAAVPVEIALYDGGRFVGATDDRPLPLDRLRFRRPGPPGRTRGPSSSDGHDGHDGPGRGEDVAVSGDRRGPILRVRRGDRDVYFRLDARSRARGYADEIGLAALATALVLLGSWLAIRHQLRPVARIGAAVERTRAGDLDARTDLSGDDDLATLGASVDAMAGRLGAMLDAKRELLLAVSHELRSPIARARVALELVGPAATSGAAAGAAAAARERLRADLLEMQGLVDALLESERLAARHDVLSLAELDLAALVRDVADGFRDAPGTVLGTRLPDAPARLVGDEARLRVLVRNLVENATLHGRGADGVARVDVALGPALGPARGSAHGDDGEGGGNGWALAVSDAGPGVPAERRDAVVEAFERLDASRSRRTGGVGLGLALARRIAEAHGGALTLGDAASGGLIVTVRLPADPSARAERNVRA